MGSDLKYGIVKGESNAIKLSAPMGASEVIAVKSGRFVTNDASGRMEIAKDGSTLLAGFVELPDGKNYSSTGIYTCSSTEGADIAGWYPAALNIGVVYRIPINSGTYAATMLGETCDISVSSNIQGAQLDASAEDTLIIVGGMIGGTSANGGWVDVAINPDKIASLTGVV
jgi:hypothetical protein